MATFGRIIEKLIHQEKPLQLSDAIRSYDRLTVLPINYPSLLI